MVDGSTAIKGSNFLERERIEMSKRKFAKIVVEEKIDGIATMVEGDDQRVEALLMELIKNLYAKNPQILKNLGAKLAKIGIAKGVLGLVGQAITKEE